MASESRLSTVYDKDMGFVGMDGQRDQLVEQVTCGEQELQVVCLLGPKGVGKTELAKEVYNKIKEHFEHRVFLSMSKKVNNRMLLGHILSQLRSRPSFGRDMEGLIRAITRYLRDDRCLVVIDGVWSPETWEEMEHVMLDGNRGSRIIITTSISDVAESCGKHSSGLIYHMKPLSSEDSVSLFRRIIFGSGGGCPIALEKVGEKIVKACGGIPLAISVIAGVLASKPAEMEQWDIVEKRMELAGADPHKKEGMREIIGISFSDLSPDIKTCLMYLSSFPENCVIRKDRLIRRWVSEGFLPKISEETWSETGERYYLELIARKLIEPVYHVFEMKQYGYLEECDDVPLGCKVHGVVYDFIKYLSSKENLVKWDISEPTGTQQDVIRRLSVSLRCDSREDNELVDLFQNKRSDDLSTVRSLTVFHDIAGISGFWTFRFLLVLDLEDNEGLSHGHLESIGCMSLLRYLGLRGTGIEHIPGEIMALKHLATLDVRGTGVQQLPAFRSSKLVSLLGDRLALREEMGEVMQRLEELSTVCGNNAYELNAVTAVVGKSNRLRMLGLQLFWPNDRPLQHVWNFFEVITKSSLESLKIQNIQHRLLVRLMLDCWANKRPPSLRRFELRFCPILSPRKVPLEIVSLRALTHLHIIVHFIEAEGLDALGKLPNLVVLSLGSRFCPAERCTVSKYGFQCLEVFYIGCKYYGRGAMGLQFAPEAMPQLGRLQLGPLQPSETLSTYGDFEFGIQHLSSLVKVRATINCRDAPASDVEAVEAAIRDQVSRIPNKPLLELSRQDEDEMRNSVVIEEGTRMSNIELAEYRLNTFLLKITEIERKKRNEDLMIKGKRMSESKSPTEDEDFFSQERKKQRASVQKNKLDDLKSAFKYIIEDEDFSPKKGKNRVGPIDRSAKLLDLDETSQV